MHNCKFDCDMTGPEWAFRKLMHAHFTAHGAVFERLGLKEVGQPRLLFILNDLRREGKRCTQRELAELMDRSPSTMTNSINSLEKHGYIRRIADEQDKRRNYVEITEEGVRIAEKCRRAFDDIDRAMFEGFSAEQRSALADVFNRAAVNLTALAEGGESEECNRND